MLNKEWRSDDKWFTKDKCKPEIRILKSEKAFNSSFGIENYEHRISNRTAMEDRNI